MGDAQATASPSHPDYFRLKGERAEAVVRQLAEKSFLHDWCFPSPRLPDGKELCDLLVVFDDVALIWQIKDLKLDDNGFYKRKGVEKNLRQLVGARRALLDVRSPIRLANSRRTVEAVDPSTIREVFLISAMMGEPEEASSFAEEMKDHNIHVVGRSFTEILLNELDTVADFVAYLRAKEQLFAGGKSILIEGGEENLLGLYLNDNRSFQALQKADMTVVGADIWAHVTGKPEFAAKKQADRISYGWDSIIDRVHEGSDGYELVARELARPNRFQRRILSKHFMDGQAFSHRTGKPFRRVFQLDETTSYCFLFDDDSSPAREGRKKHLAASCFVTRGTVGTRKVVGVATEKRFEPTCAYDFVVLDQPDWTAQDQATMEDIKKAMGILTKPLISRLSEDEYPSHE